MALITCKDCKKEFSTDAKRCPHCGAKKPVERWGIGGIFAFIFLIIFVGAVVGSGGSKNDERKNPQAYVLSYCREFIKDSLHDPSSAEFDPVYPKPFTLPGNEYEITLPLRAKNGFGAMRHFAVDCIVRFNGDSWSLVKLKEIE